MSIELNEKQIQGLQIAVERYNHNERYTVIAGYAGTGKSTLVRFIIDALRVPEEDIVYCAYTGKATQVLQKKGNKNTSTLHKLLWDSYPTKDGGFKRVPKLSIDYKIVVVDECSMVPKEMVDMLAKHRECHYLFLGDPGQLPPIDKDADNHLLDTPHIFLDEIMRQESESEIISLSMKIRNGEDIPLMKGKDVQVISKDELNTGMLMWADQILVATNATRVAINNQMRQLLGRGEKPEDGDKVICLRNYWSAIGEEESALINGTIGTIHNPYESFISIPSFKTLDGNPKRVDTLVADFVSDTNESFGTFCMDKKLILEGEPALNKREAFNLSSRKPYMEPPMEFTYGYAITGHKSQGSEWDKVLIIEEKFPFAKDEHKRWLYTCVTRSASKVVLVKA